MALTIQKAEQPAGKLTSDRRLYLTADKAKVVEEGDLSAAFLLIGKGHVIPAAEVERYGLAERDGRVVLSGSKPEPKAAEEPKPAAPAKAKR